MRRAESCSPDSDWRTITDRCRCRSTPTNCLPSYSSIGASYVRVGRDTPSIRREPHEERRPRPFITSGVLDIEPRLPSPGAATSPTCRTSESVTVIGKSPDVLGFPLKQFTNRGTWSVGPQHLAGRARAHTLRPPEPAPEKRCDGRRHERAHDQRVEQQTEADGGPDLTEH